MRSFSATHVIGDNFGKLMDLRHESIVLYCALYSFVVSPTGLFANVDLQNDDPSADPCILISLEEIADQLNTDLDTAMTAVLELFGTGLITVEWVEEDELHYFYLRLREIPEYCLKRSGFAG